VNDGLGHLNSLGPREAESEFLKCCGSTNWARRIVDQRPFTGVDELLSKADTIWWALERSDWLEAFRSHPKIGEKRSAQAASAGTRAWSEQEQSAAKKASAEMMQALADGNREYEQKFGYIFIVCATGKTSEEMLAILRDRLKNDAREELRTAAEEQRKITRLRLQKLLSVRETENQKPKIKEQ